MAIVNDFAENADEITRMMNIVEHYGAQVVGVGLFASLGPSAKGSIKKLSRKTKTRLLCTIGRVFVLGLKPSCLLSFPRKRESRIHIIK